MAHTPGPWEWNEGGRLFHSVAGSHSDNVLVIRDHIWLPSAADRDLIAASPTMLEALIAADQHFCGTHSEGGTVHKQIRAAIAKATGK